MSIEEYNIYAAQRLELIMAVYGCFPTVVKIGRKEYILTAPDEWKGCRDISKAIKSMDALIYAAIGVEAPAEVTINGTAYTIEITPYQQEAAEKELIRRYL